MKWPKNGQKWNEMAQDGPKQGRNNQFGICKGKYRKAQCLNWNNILLLGGYKDNLTSLLNSTIQGAHSTLRTLEKKISSQPINQLLPAIKQIKR